MMSLRVPLLLDGILAEVADPTLTASPLSSMILDVTYLKLEDRPPHEADQLLGDDHVRLKPAMGRLERLMVSLFYPRE